MKLVVDEGELKLEENTEVELVLATVVITLLIKAGASEYVTVDRTILDELSCVLINIVDVAEVAVKSLISNVHGPALRQNIGLAIILCQRIIRRVGNTIRICLLANKGGHAGCIALQIRSRAVRTCTLHEYAKLSIAQVF